MLKGMQTAKPQSTPCPIAAAEFFAPVWRVMRDANVTATEVAEQVGGVAAPWLGLVTPQHLMHARAACCWQTPRSASAPPFPHCLSQVAFVALAVKQGSQVSDMRHHTFRGRLRGAQVVFFRANNAGACDYFNDSRCGGAVCAGG